MIRLILLAIFIIGCLGAKTRAQTVLRPGYATLSSDLVEINNDFSGEKLSIFGVNNIECTIIAKITGPKKNLIINQKSKKYGAWLSNKRMLLEDVDTFYSVVGDVKDIGVLSKELELSVDYIQYKVVSTEIDYTESINTFFSDRTRRLDFLNPNDNIQFLSKNFFKIDINIPKSAAVGTYRADVFFIKRGKVIDHTLLSFEVRNGNFYSWLRNASHNSPVFYGLLAVLGPLCLAWLLRFVLR